MQCWGESTRLGGLIYFCFKATTRNGETSNLIDTATLGKSGIILFQFNSSSHYQLCEQKTQAPHRHPYFFQCEVGSSFERGVSFKIL